MKQRWIVEKMDDKKDSTEIVSLFGELIHLEHKVSIHIKIDLNNKRKQTFSKNIENLLDSCSLRAKCIVKRTSCLFV